jgi:uncharacterized protein (TIGR02271 family)
MTSRTITAIFDSAADAQRAQEQLFSLGLQRSDVRVINRSDVKEKSGEEKGLWESIKDFFVQDEDRATYAEGIRRGGYLLTAKVDDAYADAACDILENSNAIDLEERAAAWRSEGWSGIAPAQATTRFERTDRPEGDMEEMEEAIPIVREELRIGKREVNRGGVRVRSYVVEEPVTEQVELREERVDVERRPVRQAVQGDPGHLLKDRTIEVSESAEEAIVAKEAEITEEVVIRKFEGQRTEAVSDTVRHTEVDVEDTRNDTVIPPQSDPKKRGKGSTTSKPAL